MDKPKGSFEYYFNSAIERTRGERVKIVEVRQLLVRGNKCIAILYKESGNPNQEFCQIFYTTEEQKELVLKTFVPTKRQYKIFYSIPEFDKWIEKEKPSHVWDILNTPKYIHIEFKK